MNKDFWDNVDRLEQLAKNVKSEEWEVADTHIVRVATKGYYINDFICETSNVVDTVFIAVANPSMILELVAELRKLEKEADWLAGYIGKHECVDGEPETSICPSEESCRAHWRIKAREEVLKGKNKG